MEIKAILTAATEAGVGDAVHSDFGHRLAGQGPVAEAIGHRVALAKRRLGLGTAVRRFALDSGRFRLPPRPGDQLTLF
jgi:hypothetical protein